MKLNIRTLKQEKYEIEVEPSFTIDKVKELLEQTYKFDKSTQTLIYAGKILPNEKTIEECKIGPNEFLVLMIKRKPSTATTTTTTPSTTPATTAPAPAPTTAPTTTPSTITSPTTATATPASTSGSAAPPESEKQVAEELLTGPELERAINSIIEMGFTRERAIEALKATFNNTARAIEYLTEGRLPVTATSPNTASSQPPSSAPSRSSAPPPSTSGAGGAPSGAMPTVPGVFDGLKQHPQFPQLCHLVQTGGEETLKQILTYFAQTSRPLLDLIMANKDEFLRVLSTPVVPVSQPHSNVVRVHMTPEDERAINNLVGMGFDRNRVLEAYFLFEKDETMTANYLLNNPDLEDRGDTGSQ